MAPKGLCKRCNPKEFVRLKVLANWMRRIERVCPARAPIFDIIRKGCASKPVSSPSARRGLAKRPCKENGLREDRAGIEIWGIIPGRMSCGGVPERQEVRDERRPD
jgi:hypothetical protein